MLLNYLISAIQALGTAVTRQRWASWVCAGFYLHKPFDFEVDEPYYLERAGWDLLLLPYMTIFLQAITLTMYLLFVRSTITSTIETAQEADAYYQERRNTFEFKQQNSEEE